MHLGHGLLLVYPEQVWALGGIVQLSCVEREREFLLQVPRYVNWSAPKRQIVISQIVASQQGDPKIWGLPKNLSLESREPGSLL